MASASRSRRARGTRLLLAVALFVVLGVTALAVVYWQGPQGDAASIDAVAAGDRGQRSKPAVRRYAYVVGRPGPGERAPQIRLPATTGGEFDLSAQRGKTVLLYFQEGLMCQPCWDQLKDIEDRWGSFRRLGVDRIVSIDCDPLGASRRKAADEQITTPVLADPHQAMEAYHTNEYGMMGDMMNGHSFVLVGPDGRIRWRADYGGPDTDFTMYVPVDSLLADLRDGMAKRAL